MSELKSKRLSEDIVLFVYMGGGHIHISVALIVPESSMAFVLYSFVYHESFKVKMFRWELEAKELEAEDERVMDEIDRIRRGEEWRKGALER